MTKRERIMHCKLCGKASPSYCVGFQRQMAWLRRHRKKKHPTAHKKSVKKTVATKKKNPVPLKCFCGKKAKQVKTTFMRHTFYRLICPEHGFFGHATYEKLGGNPCK